MACFCWSMRLPLVALLVVVTNGLGVFPCRPHGCRGVRSRPIRAAEGFGASGVDNERDISKVARKGLPKSKGKAKRTERKAPPSAAKGFGAASSGLKFTRAPSNDEKPCDCASGKEYKDCCAPQHDAGFASTPESLLRARYTAFKYRLPDFLMATTNPEGPEYQPDLVSWRKELLKFCDSLCFEGLEIDREGAKDAESARITFTVNMVEKGSIKMFKATEDSLFRLRDGKWLYDSGEVSYGATDE